MEIQLILITGIIIFLAGMAQSAVGFGYALFATPLLVWTGMPLTSVITLVATCSMIQSAIGAFKLHAMVPWRLSLVTSAIRSLSVIVGLFLLKKLVVMDADYMRAIIGGILCILIVIQFFCKAEPVQALHWGWAGLAFIASGLLAGICGMGGPPLVLWAMAHDWTPHKTRGFLFAVFAFSVPIQIFLLSLTFGTSILHDAVIGIAFTPLVYLGSVIGLPIGNSMAKDKLRNTAYAILLIIGVSAIVPVLVKLFK